MLCQPFDLRGLSDPLAALAGGIRSASSADNDRAIAGRDQTGYSRHRHSTPGEGRRTSSRVYAACTSRIRDNSTFWPTGRWYWNTAGCGDERTVFDRAIIDWSVVNRFRWIARNTTTDVA